IAAVQLSFRWCRPISQGMPTVSIYRETHRVFVRRFSVVTPVTATRHVARSHAAVLAQLLNGR
ncbi:hypothetical protein ABLO02_12505, partial [Mycobacterium tuberculosis]